ncbi:MAG: response regulator [Oligoflexales bacterium]|nr:response regulator [Oligoflexales bacterium]
MSALAKARNLSEHEGSLNTHEINESPRKHVLCVHPHFKLGEMIPELEENYEVTYASNGFEALQHYYKNKGKFDVILSGIIMSQMDGFSFVSRIRKVTKKTAVYMIIDSDDVDSKTKSFFSELNVRDFFSINAHSALKEKLNLGK